MSDLVGGGGIDAAGVGLALAFPKGLREDMATLAADWAVVDEAVAAGSAGLMELGLITAGLNGSVAVARPIGVPRTRVKAAEDDGLSGVAISSERRSAGAEVGGWLGGEDGRREVWVPGSENGMVTAAPVFGTGDAEPNEGGEGVYRRDDVAEAPELGGSSESAAPVGREAGVGRAEVTRGMAGLASSGPGEAAAPVARVLAARAEHRNSQQADFGSPGDPVGAGALAGGVAPVPATMPGLRADVGAALRERAASRGTAEPERGDLGSAAFISSKPTGSRGGAAGSGFGEELSGAGPEAAWAPQPVGRGGGGPGGQTLGVVQMDGRLVGHWMTDGMAREAGRPGTGTTFFDPRQGPAWTPSGAM